MSKEVKRWDELKLLAEAAEAAQETHLRSDSEQAYDAWAHLDDQFNEKATPATVLELLAERDALLAERDALKKDAERYRWLREFIDQSPQAIEHLACSDGDLIDDVIDAALQGEQP